MRFQFRSNAHSKQNRYKHHTTQIACQFHATPMQTYCRFTANAKQIQCRFNASSMQAQCKFNSNKMQTQHKVNAKPMGVQCKCNLNSMQGDNLSIWHTDTLTMCQTHLSIPNNCQPKSRNILSWWGLFEAK